MVINESQITVCMGEPALYAIYEEEARLLAERLRPRRVLLNMDEVRMGGTCPACRGRDLGALLGECVTRQVAALRRHNPGVEVCVWSDMFDPHHNARFSDRWIEDGSYVRLKNVTLSYNIPISNDYIRGMTIWGSANNLVTLSNYLGSDPEFSMSNSIYSMGIDRGLLPLSRNFSLGLKINL